MKFQLLLARAFRELISLSTFDIVKISGGACARSTSVATNGHLYDFRVDLRRSIRNERSDGHDSEQLSALLHSQEDSPHTEGLSETTPGPRRTTRCSFSTPLSLTS